MCVCTHIHTNTHAHTQFIQTLSLDLFFPWEKLTIQVFQTLSPTLCGQQEGLSMSFPWGCQKHLPSSMQSLLKLNLRMSMLSSPTWSIGQNKSYGCTQSQEPRKYTPPVSWGNFQIWHKVWLQRKWRMKAILQSSLAAISYLTSANGRHHSVFYHLLLMIAHMLKSLIIISLWVLSLFSLVIFKISLFIIDIVHINLNFFKCRFLLLTLLWYSKCIPIITLFSILDIYL